MLDTRKLNKEIFALENPLQWASRYSNRVTLATPLFIEFDRRGNKARLLDIQGGADPDWSPMETFEGEKGWILDADTLALLKAALKRDKMGLAFCMVVGGRVSSLPSPAGEHWVELEDRLQSDRYEPSAWFERDNRVLLLTDLLTNKCIVELRDHDVEDAIESGYLTPPRHPRPSDSDWLEPLLEYARSNGHGISPQDAFTQAAAQRRIATAQPTRAQRPTPA